jgi:CHASE2 domain-containing sensor protein
VEKFAARAQVAVEHVRRSAPLRNFSQRLRARLTSATPPAFVPRGNACQPAGVAKAPSQVYFDSSILKFPREAEWFNRCKVVKKLTWANVKEELWRKSVLSVIIIVALWNVFVSSDIVAAKLQGEGPWRETFREIRDLNVHLQLRFYQLLTSWKPITFVPSRVSLVYIDDDAHWKWLFGDMPTSRGFLATLITNASQPATKASAIALDVQLYAPEREGIDKEERDRANQALLQAIKDAAGNGVPVILATGYYIEKDGRQVLIPGIFTNSQLPLKTADGRCSPGPACAALGYINPPDDRRRIPLVEQLYAENSGPIPYDSFALAVVRAMEGPTRRITSDSVVAEAMKKDDRHPIFGSFIRELPSPEEASKLSDEQRRKYFSTISIMGLYYGDPHAEAQCADRFVLIGGHWRDIQGHGQLMDSHMSPVGEISGLALHANYIESLWQHQFEPEVPVAVGVTIDVLTGLVVYVCFGLTSGIQRFAVLLSAFLIPPLVAFIFLVTFNRYLDFLLPLELYFLHIFYETAKEYGELKHAVTPMGGHRLSRRKEHARRS